VIVICFVCTKTKFSFVFLYKRAYFINVQRANIDRRVPYVHLLGTGCGGRKEEGGRGFETELITTRVGNQAP
jgi:hypothetical protein